MYEINIIPFTDIVLVVLVVFIVTTPLLLQSTVVVNLPQTTVTAPPTPEEKVRITIQQDNTIYVNDVLVSDMQQLEDKLSKQEIKDSPLTVMADEKANYGIVAQVLAIAQKNGFQKLELLTKSLQQ
ncbi:MAG: biopolymer transporter ExbD [Candidatus Riflemargulisbacteria bacterium]